MKKVKWDFLVQVILFILAILVLAITYLKNQQAAMSIPIKLDFVGEYSTDKGTTWNKYDNSIKFSSLDGNLLLRGSFENDFKEDTHFNFYINHININIYINDEPFFLDSRIDLGLIPSGCCRQWLRLDTPEISKDDIIKIELINPHKIGNREAYNEFLSSIYIGNINVFNSYMLKYGNTSRIIGFAIIIVAIMLLGVSLASTLLQIDIGKSLGKLGFFTIFTGGFFVLDTKDVSLWSFSNIINTYVLQICMMLSVFCLTMCVAFSVKTKARKIAEIASVISFITDIILFLLSLFGVMVIYDTGIYWLGVHLIIFVVLLFALIYEYFKGDKKDPIVVLSYILLISAIIFDFVNSGVHLWNVGIVSKAVFLVLFLIHIIRLIKVIPRNYRAAVQAEKIAKELQNSRISIMLSQIKPHFLHNCINAIRELCRQNPNSAREALGDFSDYLRLNMESINSEALIHFSRELKHIKKYLKLEKMRFEDDLNIVYDIEEEDFFIPPLVVQPLVENAVKHGICQAEKGGTLTIHTKREGDKITIIITDDGVGFDISKLNKNDKNHIGIENVKKRLEYMVGGKLDIKSEIGKGTTAKITFYR
ncbi:MAG: sensor histidine kinase [Lachnospirales bacterium]